ncbi:GPO family capsid scaffolding protein [Xanthomonas cannabis]|uniref:GPO family capsid scaffolding protein n=1 Tax=Xanthomonas cannabis TaxID=1885674 RepID=UPI00141BA40E|nr:GPO family capsid scaffolding protein [Xanthomonas cannabis]NIK17407.1 hypothetical protein [Xanthomonas cannabis]
MSAKAKKFRSNWFRVAVEGATTDGRTIQRSWIDDMAATYNRETYNARIWIEHMRSLLPDSPFRAYGDVTAVKAEEVEIDGTKRLALFAQIEPTADLITINKSKQKLYTSIEVQEKFANTGKAYLVGLAVTDSPASLGTSMLSFASQNPDANPLTDRKQSPGNLFTAAEETALEFSEVSEGPVANLLSRIRTALKSEDATSITAEQFAELGQGVEEIAEHVRGQDERFNRLQAEHAEQKSKHEQLANDLAQLRESLSQQPDPAQPARPVVTGGGAVVLTDC